MSVKISMHQSIWQHIMRLYITFYLIIGLSI